MPITFTVTKEDILRSKVLNPGWYKAKITKVSQEPAKSDGGESTNTWVDLSVVSGPLQNDGSSPTDVPVRRCFSEKAPGFILPFLKALNTKVEAGGGQFDLERSVGREVMVYIKNREWQGSMQNDVADFRAV